MMKAAFVPLMLALFCSCGSAQQEVPVITSPPASTADAFTDTAQAFAVAVADYIKVMKDGEGAVPDTLYIGRHQDFPDISLPEVIENTAIRIVTPAEGEALQEREHFAYLNIFPTFLPGEVEFFVVRFQQGMRHHPDGHDDRHLHYSTKDGSGVLTLEAR